MSSLPGITRQDEEKRLQHTLEIAQRKVEANRQSVQALAEELHAMQEEFDENDKEAQTLWHNADARFKFVNQDLRRAEQARKKPYFGRIDFRDKKLKKDEVYYIGRSVIADNPAEPEVIDWRAPDAIFRIISYSTSSLPLTLLSHRSPLYFVMLLSINTVSPSAISPEISTLEPSDSPVVISFFTMLPSAVFTFT